MTMNRFAIPFLFCAILSASSPLRAEEEARLPYKLIYEIQQRQAVMGHTYTNLLVFIRMKSTLPSVKTSDLNVYIDSKEGKMPVSLDANGVFSVPMRDSLLAENPPIMVNQPKGSMELGWYVGLVEHQTPTNGIHYAAMMRPLKDLEAIRAQMVPSVSSSSIRGMKFYYAPDTEGVVVIHAKAGDRTYRTDQSHTLIIPWEQALLAEDPPITFSSPPQKFDVANEE
jgi:hypothetical protein